MMEEYFSINPFTNKRYRLDGIIRSTRLPTNNLLCQAYKKVENLQYDKLPAKIDLRSGMTPVEDQSQIGSCSANTLAGSYEYLLKKATGRVIDVSRLFIYYNARVKSGTKPDRLKDNGCTMTDAIEALEEYGTCLESIWPYNISRVNARPSDQAYQQARAHRITEAVQIDVDLKDMKSCLAGGFPFAFGIVLFKSFDDAAEKGRVPMPKSSDSGRQKHGNHAMLAVGYDDNSKVFIVRNSWGSDWGDRGYCYIPYDYMADSEYCFDVWAVRKLMSSNFNNTHAPFNNNHYYLNNNTNRYMNNTNNVTRDIQPVTGNYPFNNIGYDPFQNPWPNDYSSNTYQNDQGNDSNYYKDTNSYNYGNSNLFDGTNNLTSGHHPTFGNNAAFDSNAPFLNNPPFDSNPPFNNNSPFDNNLSLSNNANAVSSSPFGNNLPFNNNPPFGNTPSYDTNLPFGNDSSFQNNPPFDYNSPFSNNVPFDNNPPFNSNPTFDNNPPFGNNPHFNSNVPFDNNPPFGNNPPFDSNPAFGNNLPYSNNPPFGNNPYPDQYNNYGGPFSYN